MEHATVVRAAALDIAGASTAIGLDMGGTFVDCVVTRSRGEIFEAKAPTTPDDPLAGIEAGLDSLAVAAGISIGELLAETTAIVHGTTLGINTLLEGRGGRVGLLATHGHEDALLIGRVHQKVAGLRPDEIGRAADLRKPAPLVPRWDIAGIHERIDAAGNVVVPLDEAGVVEAARRLVAAGCEALAVAFLWSHLRPDHERRAAELVETAIPGVPVVCSSAVAPVLGEYERTAAAAVNASLLGPFGGYLERLRAALAGRGFRGRLWVMGMTGGVVAVEVAAGRPVETLRSGPVGGAMATARLGRMVGRDRLIATDMGGTSFDVGLLIDGEPQQTDLTLVGQFHLAVPGVDVRSIGAGGGSVAWLDQLGGLHVGPRSAGSHPGPACYGRGGTEPTVTDADVVLGRLPAGAVLGGQIRLDGGAAVRAVGALAVRLGVGLAEAAAGIVTVADAQMADLVRRATIEQGHDPRDFTLVAYGGAGPLHVGRFAADVGVQEAIVPPSASVFSALGLATAGYRRTYRRSRRMRLPLDPAGVAGLLAILLHEAEADFATSGLAGRLTVIPWVDIRYRRQTHQLRIPSTIGTDGRMDLDGLEAAFEARYARTFGAGTGYRAAGMEASAMGVHAFAARTAPPAVGGPPASTPGAAPGSPTPVRRRRAWFDGWVDDTAVHTGSALCSGTRIPGPAIVEWGSTSLVVHPGQLVAIDEDGNARLRFAAAPQP
jgi:N-methylhydantoinase A